jgi:hypothetical protein
MEVSAARRRIALAFGDDATLYRTLIIEWVPQGTISSWNESAYEIFCVRFGGLRDHRIHAGRL